MFIDTKKMINKKINFIVTISFLILYFFYQLKTQQPLQKVQLLFLPNSFQDHT